MKKLIAILVILCIIPLCFAFASEPEESAETPVKLSSMSDEECRAFLVSQGVVFPDTPSVQRSLNEYHYSWMIAELEENPDAPNPMLSGAVYFNDIFEQARAVVKAYYGIDTQTE